MNENTMLPTDLDAPREKMFNIPPLTFALVSFLLAIHIACTFLPELGMNILAWTVFMPSYFNDYPLASSYRLASYGLVHINWLHLFVNLTGLAAFGSGIERLSGKRWMIGILILGTILGALGQWACNMHSDIPLAGASAGICALFGALLPLIVPKKSLFAGIMAFVITNMAVGFMGMPDQPGLAIAWQAHIAGFLFGILVGMWKREHMFVHDEHEEASI